MLPSQFKVLVIIFKPLNGLGQGYLKAHLFPHESGTLVITWVPAPCSLSFEDVIGKHIKGPFLVSAPMLWKSLSLKAWLTPLVGSFCWLVKAFCLHKHLVEGLPSPSLLLLWCVGNLQLTIQHPTLVTPRNKTESQRKVKVPEFGKWRKQFFREEKWFRELGGDCNVLKRMREWKGGVKRLGYSNKIILKSKRRGKCRRQEHLSPSGKMNKRRAVWERQRLKREQQQTPLWAGCSCLHRLTLTTLLL